MATRFYLVTNLEACFTFPLPGELIMDIRGRRSLVYNVCQYDEEKDITTVKIECACARVVLHRLERRTRIEWYPPGIESSTPFSNEFWDCDGFISLRFDMNSE